MAANPMISMAAAIAALNAVTALLNVGGAGKIEIWSGTPPTALGGSDAGTKLSTLPLSSTSFPTAVDGSTNGLATATANTITSDTNAANSGTAQYFRAYANGGTAVIQGTVGTSSADMILNTTAIVAGSTVAITSWVVTLPDGSGID
jgi:hypothetical protein